MARVVAAAGVALFNEPELFVFDLLQIDALRFICIFNFIGKNRFKVQINDPPKNRSKIKCIDLVFGSLCCRVPLPSWIFMIIKLFFFKI